MERAILQWSSLGHLLESATAEHGDKPLFIFKGERASYREINERVSRVANGLRTIGDFPNLTATMEKRGWPEARIRKVMGENWLRVLKEVWGA